MKIIVIGAGPGGYETALDAAARGIEVVLVEAGEVGGTCLNRGCIPTKTLCRSAEVLEEVRNASGFGIFTGVASLDFGAVNRRKDEVVGQLRSGVETLLKHKLITLVRGTAELKDGHTVVVRDSASVMDSPVSDFSVKDSYSIREFTADYIVIASGSSAALLPVSGNHLPGVLTSNEILELKDVPKSICIIGAGVIGLEFASIFRSFGTEVTVLEYCRDILPRFDTDLSKRLKQSLSKRGIEIITQASVKAISEVKVLEGKTSFGLVRNGLIHDGLTPDGSAPDGQVQEADCCNLLQVEYERKGAAETALAEKVLMAVGRRPNVEGLGLEVAGVEYSAKGIIVDENMQTSCPSVYAVGDVNGRMMLAHAAVYQGRRALNHICGVADSIDFSVVPSSVFTMPEAASVGLTEDECKERGIACRCLKSSFRANGKAVSAGQTDGFCKLVVADGRIAGCHMYGPHASDLVQEVCVLINKKASIDDFRDIIHAHPTLGEVLQDVR